MKKRLLPITTALALTALFISPTAVPAQEENSEQFVNLGEYSVEYDEIFTDDSNGDGREEMTLYYLNDVLVASTEDTNQDGKPDFWLRYTPDWYADMEIRDTDLDGKPDEFTLVDENEAILSVEQIDPEQASDHESDSDSGGNVFVWIIVIIAAVLFLGAAVFIFMRKRAGLSMAAADSIPSANFCTDCGTNNGPGSVFCKKCGGKLSR